MASGKRSSRRKKVPEDTEKDVLRRILSTESIEEILGFTTHESATVRLAALRQMCPCRVKRDIDDFWRRVFSMVGDEDSRVRFQVLHTVCDGSPPHLEDEIVEVLQACNRDSDKKIRRQAHKVLGEYSRTGRWNIL